MALMLVVVAWGSPALCGGIHDAAKGGDVATVKALIQRSPALAFSRDREGATPLHLAAQNGHKDVAEVLLGNHADVNAKNDGTTPLHLAAHEGYKDVVEVLLAHHADVNIKTDDGVTPLDVAAGK